VIIFHWALLVEQQFSRTDNNIF